MSQPVTPIFLFSLPRSGSTLLQRILASHPLICTASEPWLLLPMFYGLRAEGTYAEYNHHSVHNALADFINALPEGRLDYLRQLNRFVTGLYQSVSVSGERYFLDKTPRYHLVVDEILETFPSAKFIFLWRNPLAVIGSSLETFGNGKWRLYEYRIDFYKGLENLHAAYIQNRDKVARHQLRTIDHYPRRGIAEATRLPGSGRGNTGYQQLFESKTQWRARRPHQYKEVPEYQHGTLA